jgi:predicted Rossmann fold nucleotide-binding protein DprA/Smf involved in DNA uptake
LPEFVDTTVKEIDARLSQLKEELSRLEAARTALVGDRRGPGRPRGARTTRSRTTRSRTTRSRRTTPTTATRRTRPRGRRGGATRANQALELVRGKPGISIPEIAKQMGIEPNYLYRVLPRLQQEGQIKKDGGGWVPA